MDVYEAIERRYSVRSYEDRAVEDEKLNRILNAARLAPSGMNRQEWKFVVVRDPARRKAMSEVAEQPFLAEAPVIVAAVATEVKQVGYNGITFGPVDCAIAVDHMTLAAMAEGLGTCWIAHFRQDDCRKLLNVPDSAKVIELMTLGYPAEAAKKAAKKPRKPTEEVVTYETFQAD